MDKDKARSDRELVAWAKRALHGLDESHLYVGILSSEPMSSARAEFLLQLAHAILLDKPIILPVPHGVVIPKKLEAVADRIVRYSPDDPESLTRALVPVFTEFGINKQ